MSPRATVCAVFGLIAPFAPALGVTVKVIGTQTVAPVTSVVVPAAQAVCEVAPVAATKKPSAAGVQAAELLAALKLPAAHRVWAVAPATATKLPALAGVHTLAPAADEKLPTAHSVAEVAPVVATKLPAGAGVQGALPVAEKLPAAHCTGFSVKVAVTVLRKSIVTAHVPVPVQPAPLQPAKLPPATGVAVRVVIVLWA